MPAPTMAPTPSMVRCPAPSVRRRVCAPASVSVTAWVTGLRRERACTGGPSARAAARDALDEALARGWRAAAGHHGEGGPDHVAAVVAQAPPPDLVDRAA